MVDIENCAVLNPNERHEEKHPVPFKEVYSEIMEDFAENEITTEKAAELLGYKTRQTLYNLRSSKDYMKPEQANRFVRAFGYSYEYLTTGIGSLMPNKNEPSSIELELIGKLKFSELRLTALVHIATTIICNAGNPTALKAWSAINNRNLDQYLINVQSLIRQNTGMFVPGQDDQLCGRIACKKDMDDLIKDMGYIDADMLAQYIFGNNGSAPIEKVPNQDK